MKIAAWSVCILFASAAVLYGFPAASLAYVTVVVLHTVLGLLFTVFLFARIRSFLRDGSLLSRTGWAAMLLAGVLGAILIYVGGSRPEARWLNAHILVSCIAVVCLGTLWMCRRWGVTRKIGAIAALCATATVVIAVAFGTHHTREYWWDRANRIENPRVPPASMDGEGDGPNGPFFPSSAQVKQGTKIPSKFFMESEACKRCHADIYNQWFSSMHHFSSFNNQWYRASIEYMQDVIGTKPSKWCGGCHDPAVLYSGLMDTPIKQIVKRPESQAGLGCMMCHSIAKVKSTMGQGDFVLDYPKLHELAASNNPVIRFLHDFTTKLNPEPHRRVFLKPFMKKQTAEFCSSCHKVHLDVPVNSYRWSRGFNEYDNWQASGVSGQGARSFYYPPKSQKCADCHMPDVVSKDFGNVNGMIHSHAFPGANTAVPTANEDPRQLELTERFLKDAVTVDVFAMSPAAPKASHGAAVSTEMATTFAVGEEAESTVSNSNTAEPALPVSAPLDRVHATVRRGDSVRVDVVVRTRKLGHFFPGGTVDAYDTWVELKAVDNKNQVLFWSGMVEQDGKGPVEPGAHFYRSLMIDSHGNPINKRNAWASRAVVYVRLIPPGAADTVHYRLYVPEYAGNKIKLEARLCYRKFAWWNTQFSFAGEPDPNQQDASTAPHYDDRKFVFTASTANVSGKKKTIPVLPIVAISHAEATLNVAPKNSKREPPKVVLDAKDWTRWNDYGIGLLAQGDLRGAQQAFSKIVEADQKNVDGWVNLGRVAVQEGDMERAREVLKKALVLNPDLARTNFFYAKVLRADGNYGEAVERLQAVTKQYPRDRVVLNDLGRNLFLQRKYAEAVAVLQQVLSIDPEDLMAHYNLMLCYQGLGQTEQAETHQKLYLRFKADEAAQALTGSYRQAHPEDNNERQAIHEHVSVNLGVSRTREQQMKHASNRKFCSGNGCGKQHERGANAMSTPAFGSGGEK